MKVSPSGNRSMTARPTSNPSDRQMLSVRAPALLPEKIFSSPMFRLPSCWSRTPLLIALLSGLMAHFIEIHFGIAIAATRTYFWTYAALMVVIGCFLRRRPSVEAPAPAEKPRSRRRRGRKGRTPKGPGRELWAMVASSLPMGMILATMGFDYISPQFDLAAKSYSMLWLFLLTWVLGGGVVLAEEAIRRRGAKIAPYIPPLLYALVSLGSFFLFYVAHRHQLGTLMALAQRGDAMGAANAGANIIGGCCGSGRC